MNEKHATIHSTFLGINEHDTLTFWLDLDYGDATPIQGAGGIKLTGDESPMLGKPAISLIRAVLEIVGVATWEELKGKQVRALVGNRVHAIGNSTDDKWLDFKTLKISRRTELKNNYKNEDNVVMVTG